MNIDGFPINVDDITGVGVIVAVAILVITNRLVWHTRLREVEQRAERWEKVALEALTTGARAGVAAAEVSSEVLTKLPDTTREAT